VTLALLTLVLQACIPGNLAEHKPVMPVRTMGYPGVVVDGVLAQESTVWNAPQSIVLGGAAGSLVVDLGGEYELRALVVQADNDDRYFVETSEDAANWRPIWVAEPQPAPGLRTRWGPLAQPEAARFVRIRGESGDGNYAVSELRAYCEIPPQWPPKLIAPPRFDWKNFEFKIAVERFAVAIFGCLVFALGLFYRGRLYDVLMIAVGLLSIGAFYSWGDFHDGRFVHLWEHYHYYIGSKYFNELGYTRLYTCSAIAESEDGLRARVLHRKQRNLETNDLEETAPILAHPEVCKDHFTPERWQQFKADVRYFRSELNATNWESIQSDHGFNGTPFWSVGANLLARWLPATRAHIRQLAYLDVALIGLMWICVAWAFGWRTMVVAMLLWGTNHPARYYWNGGAFLRMDWLFTLIASLCCMKKNRPTAAGILLGISALLRIFPGFVIGALILRWLWRGIRQKDWQPPAASKRTVLAFALTLVAGFAISSATFGPKSWVGFVKNSEKHLSTPLTNNMGLKSIVGWSWDTRASLMRDNRLVDPFHTWKVERRNMYKKRMPLFLALLAGFFVLFAYVAAGADETTTLILGISLIVCSAELTSYYYSFMLGFAFLWPRYKPVALLLAMASASTTVIMWCIGGEDDSCILISVVYLVFILLTMWLVRRKPEPLWKGTWRASIRGVFP
jgi:hypothetical protein